jgi:hypothetical protein
MRVFVSYVPIMMGLSAKRTLKDVLDELRKQEKNEEPQKDQCVDPDTYWALVGLIMDAYSQPRKVHIDFLHNYFAETHPEAWYEKLYEAITTSIARSERPKTQEVIISPNVILCGKPFAIEGDKVIHVVRSKQFQGMQEDIKVMLMCYMKICGVKNGILREVCGTETQDILQGWDSKAWANIKRAILATLKLL